VGALTAARSACDPRVRGFQSGWQRRCFEMSRIKKKYLQRTRGSFRINSLLATLS
jgi:hypothetical protein